MRRKVFATSANKWFFRNPFTWRRAMVCMQFGRCWLTLNLGRGVVTPRDLNCCVRERSWKPTRRVHMTWLRYYERLEPTTEKTGELSSSNVGRSSDHTRSTHSEGF